MEVRVLAPGGPLYALSSRYNRGVPWVLLVRWNMCVLGCLAPVLCLFPWAACMSLKIPTGVSTQLF